MSSKIIVKVEELNALPATKIVENENVQAKFIQMYNAIWGTQTGTQIYQKEVFNFQKLLRENPELANCSKMSLYGCFLDMAVNGLSLDPTGRPHCYLLPRSVKTGHKDERGKDIYEKRASVSVTAYGELTMRMRAGQVKYVDNPVIVYEGDQFSVSLNKGIKFVEYSAKCPRTSTKVIAAFIRIVRNDGSEDYQWLMEGDILRLKAYSERANAKWNDQTRRKENGQANALYTSNDGQIDPGFLENKMIKHAFDAYPKVRTGQFTTLETGDEEQEIDYGIEEAGEVEVVTENSLSPGFGDNTPEPEKPIIQVQTTQEDDDAGF